MSSKEVKGWRKMDQGIAVFRIWWQAMMARNQGGLRADMNRSNTVSNEYGMNMFIKKTKVLKISKC